MNIIHDLIGRSPFGPIVEHSKKVHECIELIRPLMEALLAEDYEEVHQLQDKVSKLEYEADVIKHELRESLIRRYFLPVDREELDNFVEAQEKIADHVQDFAVILTLRNTIVHPTLHQPFLDFVNQVFQVSGTLLTAAVEFKNLAEVSFSGAEAKAVLTRIKGLGEEEWKADRMARRLSQAVYRLENEVSPLTIIFYEKMIIALGAIANDAENAGDYLRTMIIKG